MTIETHTVRDHPRAFAHSSSLPGSQALAAVGQLAAGASRPEVDAVLHDAALTEGYDAEAVLTLANAALAVEELGTVDAVALFSANDMPGGVPVHVTGAGHPAPMIVRPDASTAPAGDGCALSPGSTVLLGSQRSLVRIVVA